MSDCIFCKIIDKQVPAKVEYEDERVIVFHDIHPKAPVHLLAVPKKHIPTILDVEEMDMGLIGHIHTIAQKMARSLGFEGMRLVNNCGERGGQEVFHLHYHILGWK